MLKGFKSFIFRGNVLDLAVAVVVGAAFGGVITAFVRDLLTPLIAAIGGQPDFSTLSFTINNSRFLYGDFINALVSFVIVAAAVYFLVVAPLSRSQQRRAEGAIPLTRKCPECFSEVFVQARKCPHCTSVISPPAVSRTGS